MEWSWFQVGVPLIPWSRDVWRVKRETTWKSQWQWHTWNKVIHAIMA